MPARVAPEVEAETWVERFRERVASPERRRDFYDELFARGAAPMQELGALLDDVEALRGLPEGDSPFAPVPPEVNRRELALSLLEAVLVHPRASSEVREAALATLGQVAGRPLDDLHTERALRAALSEKRRALLALARSDRSSALGLFHSLEDEVLRWSLRRAMLDALVASGLPRGRARRLVSDGW